MCLLFRQQGPDQNMCCFSCYYYCDFFPLQTGTNPQQTAQHPLKFRGQDFLHLEPELQISQTQT